LHGLNGLKAQRPNKAQALKSEENMTVMEMSYEKHQKIRHNELHCNLKQNTHITARIDVDSLG